MVKPHGQAACLGHQHRIFLARCEFINDPMGNLPLQLFNLGVLKMFCIPISECKLVVHKANVEAVIEGKAVLYSNVYW